MAQAQKMRAALKKSPIRKVNKQMLKNKKIYLRGKIGQYWYNFTELLVYALTVRPCPKDLIYTKSSYDKGSQHKIYTYCRKDLVKEKKPLFIYIHGGGWISGVTPMRNRYVSEWAKKGFYCASIGYTYAPDAIFPTQIKEIFKALDQILDSAEENNFDPENIVIAGESAGGYYISYVASCLNDKSILDALDIEFKNADKMKIKALVSLSGCFDLQRITDVHKKQSEYPDIRMMASTFVGKPFAEAVEFLRSEEAEYYSPKFTEDFPPTFAVWAVKDKLRYETFDLQEDLETLGVPCKTYKADGIISNHAWSVMPIFKKSKDCIEEAYEFVMKYIEK